MLKITVSCFLLLLIKNQVYQERYFVCFCRPVKAIRNSVHDSFWITCFFFFGLVVKDRSRLSLESVSACVFCTGMWCIAYIININKMAEPFIEYIQSILYFYRYCGLMFYKSQRAKRSLFLATVSLVMLNNR